MATADPPAPTPPTHATPRPAAPLWDGYCADPFVLREDGGRYVMYGTTPVPLPGGRAFQVLVSDDLESWQDAGGALEVGQDTPAGTEFWAPEVAWADGRYWMYYSAGIGDSGHRLRVATSSEATGPFQDSGAVLTPDLPFAIDPSPYRDRTGAWWLFYATDLVEGDRPGTVLAVQRLVDMTRLDGSPEVILRATADWQRYEADREMYGGVHDWHTLEGPAVLDDADGGCVLLYSGGNWQTPGYGVAAARADAAAGPWHEDAARAPLVTSASTGLVGPGHCSVLSAEDGSHHLFLHAWDRSSQRRRPYRMALRLQEGTVVVDHPTPRLTSS